jgi:hypothetical protein
MQTSGSWNAVTGCVFDQKLPDSKAFGQEILCQQFKKKGLGA